MVQDGQINVMGEQQNVTDGQQDILEQALQKLENELNQFKNVQDALKNAHDQLMKAEQEWETLTKEQKERGLELVGATRSAINATLEVTSHAQTLTNALVPLAEAIRNVNFPLRLDRIDLTQSSQLTRLDSMDTKIANVHRLSDRNFPDINRKLDRGEKRDIWILALLIINAVAIVGYLVFNFFRKF